MSSVELEDGRRHEIIIVKRGHDDEHEHHGGVWKIAFADFMTAMMCFFLVMWLINAANEQTKAAVASYFNPVKLIDRNSSRKGLEDLGDGPNSSGLSVEIMQEASGKSGAEGNARGGAENDDKGGQAAKPAEQTDNHLFADPYAVLAEIATNTEERQNISDRGEGGAQDSGPATGASGGESYRDPFAPDFWTQQVAMIDAAEASAERSKVEEETQELTPQDKALLDELAGKPGKSAKTEKPTEIKPEQAETAEAKATEQTKATPAEVAKAETAKAEAEEQVEKPAEKSEIAEAEKAPTAETVKSAEEIKHELDKAFAKNEAAYDGIAVEATDKGVLISVTEQLDFGMFEIGSAMPRRELVLAMEKIGKSLGAQKGTVTINGHTDGRPFRSATYDNWRLSTARAHAAYYMLVRGGLEERRITEVAGFADRKLKVPAEPYSSSNRRIEILLEPAR